MKIKVYQIDEKFDRHNIGFRSYDSVMKTVGRVDPSIYKTVYNGNIDAENLEEIYTICNDDHPVGYNGHSMSVGDVVELEDGSCHFCDSFGFNELKDFDTEKVAPIIGHKMLVIEPHKEPYEMVIPDGLEPLQQAVRGYIEVTYPFDDNAFVIGNEEAKLIGMEGNRTINGQIYAGPILIAADDGYGGTTDLTDEQIQKYTHEFAVPEVISDAEVANSIKYMIYGFN